MLYEWRTFELSQKRHPCSCKGWKPGDNFEALEFEYPGILFPFWLCTVVETHGGRNILVLPFSCLRQSPFPWAKLDVNKLLFWTVPTTKHLQKISHCKLLFDPIIQLVWISKLECTRHVMTIIMGATSPTSDFSWKTVNLIKSSLCCFIEALCSRELSGFDAAKPLDSYWHVSQRKRNWDNILSMCRMYVSMRVPFRLLPFQPTCPVSHHVRRE